MRSRPRPWQTALATLPTLLLLPGCALLSHPQPVAVQCPVIPPLAQEARQRPEFQRLLEAASDDLQRWSPPPATPPDAPTPAKARTMR